ncbi:MAG: twin-arginine translocase subunit TatC [Mycobacterium leprae]
MIDKAQPLVEHLAELRRRVIWAAIAVFVGIVGFFSFSQPIFNYLMSTAEQGHVILVQHTYSEAFMTQFRLSIIGGIIIAFPFVLYQLVAFVLPALRPSERRILYIGLPMATGLFLVGWAFGWFVVVPITRNFFLGTSTQAHIQNQITPQNYLDFIMGLCNPLGIVFELPLVVMILARIGFVTASFLRRVRKYAILVLLIVAAILSPPDVISMMIFFVPLYALYEVSIVMAQFARKKRA